jgi:hypothetical protein
MSRFKNRLLTALLILFLLIPLVSLLVPGLPFTHDGRDHVARIANFYQNLLEGNFIPIWAANLNWGYGHPILEFLYPLPSYFASLFHFIGFSFVDSTKITFGLGFFLSGLFMYLWLSQFLKKDQAVFGAILYTYAPYRFVDLYVRGAIGENFAFIWLPLVLYFVCRLSKKDDYFNFSLLAISFGLLILSHNALSIIFLPFILFYGIFLYTQGKSNKLFLVKFLFSIILGFGLSAFFWIPAYLEGKYTLRNILTSGTYIDKFVYFKNLLYGKWSYGQSGQFTVQLGPLHWLGTLISLFAFPYFLKRKNKLSMLTLGTLVYTFIAIFLMLEQSNFIWERVMILQNFQFPWRMLAVTVFSTSLLGAVSLSILKDSFRKWLVAVLIVIVFLISFNHMKPKGYLLRQESFYTNVFESTTDTGESSPIWSVRFMEKKFSSPIQVIEGKAEVKEKIHRTTYRSYEFKSKDSARVLINTLYFPNWVIYIDGKEKATQFQDPRYRGLMTFYVTGGSHKIEAVFKNTKVRSFSDLISFFSVLFIIALFSYKIIKR